jgi:steroid delta-isomerase-like uncharacterized protein
MHLLRQIMATKPLDNNVRIGEKSNSKLVAELLEAWNAHDIDHAVTFYAADYTGIDVSEAAPQRGPDGIRQTLTRYMSAFPDLQFVPEATFAHGDQVAMFWSAQGTHQGPLMNIPPSGRLVRIRGVSLLTVTNGQVSRGLYIWDVAGLLRNIGLLPEL